MSARRLSEYTSPGSYLASEHGVETYNEAWRRLGDLVNKQAELTREVDDVIEAITAVWPPEAQK